MMLYCHHRRHRHVAVVGLMVLLLATMVPVFCSAAASVTVKCIDAATGDTLASNIIMKNANQTTVATSPNATVTSHTFHYVGTAAHTFTLWCQPATAYPISHTWLSSSGVTDLSIPTSLLMVPGI